MAVELDTLAYLEAEVDALLVNKVSNDITGITGSTKINNMMEITSTGYQGIPPDANTLYLIKD